jgi:hypothetical protein
MQNKTSHSRSKVHKTNLWQDEHRTVSFGKQRTEFIEIPALVTNESSSRLSIEPIVRSPSDGLATALFIVTGTGTPTCVQENGGQHRQDAVVLHVPVVSRRRPSCSMGWGSLCAECVRGDLEPVYRCVEDAGAVLRPPHDLRPGPGAHCPRLRNARAANNQLRFAHELVNATESESIAHRFSRRPRRW